MHQLELIAVDLGMWWLVGGVLCSGVECVLGEGGAKVNKAQKDDMVTWCLPRWLRGMSMESVIVSGIGDRRT